jgi:hypothetical protein
MNTTPNSIERLPASVCSPFVFSLPRWVNGAAATSAEEALFRAEDIARAYYAAGAQTGVHAMIEWCGVMTEYAKMLRVGAEERHDPREVDKHHAGAVKVPDYMVVYLCEKLGCQLIPFMRGNIELWRREIECWFSEANDKDQATASTRP